MSPRSQEFMDEACDRLAAARQIAKSGHPERTHVIAAGSPDQGEMATRALFAGDPVAIV